MSTRASGLSVRVNFIQKLKNIKIPKILIFIFFCGIILRLYYFPSQLWLGSDITRDVSISLESLNRFSLPSTGSFSSGGPFVFGPGIYWLYMLSFIIFPFSLLAPWFLTFLFGVFTMVALYIFVSKQVDSRALVLLALVVALSPQLVISTSVPTQHTFVLCFTVLALIFLKRYWDNSSRLSALFIGLCVGMAINMHYQAVAIFPLPILIFFSPKKAFLRKMLDLSISYLGVFFTLFAVLFWDSHQAFANTRNLLDYLLIGQSRLYVPNSWRIFLLDYLPGYWFLVTGIPKLLFLPMFFVGSTFFALEIIRTRKISFALCIVSFLYFLLFLTRYYKGERFPGYTLYLVPFLIFFSIWTFSKATQVLIKISKFGNGVLINVLLLLLIFYAIVPWYEKQTTFDRTLGNLSRETDRLKSQYPNQKFQILNYGDTNPDASFAMSVYLTDKNMVEDGSLSLGFCNICSNELKQQGELMGTKYFVLEDTHETDKRWNSVSQAGIYDSTIGWLNQHQLKSTFYLDKYIKEKIFR